MGGILWGSKSKINNLKLAPDPDPNIDQNNSARHASLGSTNRRAEPDSLALTGGAVFALLHPSPYLIGMNHLELALFVNKPEREVLHLLNNMTHDREHGRERFPILELVHMHWDGEDSEDCHQFVYFGISMATAYAVVDHFRCAPKYLRHLDSSQPFNPAHNWSGLDPARKHWEQLRPGRNGLLIKNKKEVLQVLGLSAS